MWTIALCMVAATAQTPSALEELAVIEKALSIGIGREQAARLVPIAERANEARQVRDSRLAELEDSLDVSDILQTLVSGERLTIEQIQKRVAAQSIRSRPDLDYRKALDAEYAAALAVLTDQQVMRVAGMNDLYTDALVRATRLRTARDSDWPEVRKMLTLLLTDREYEALRHSAIRDWETRFGRTFEPPWAPPFSELGVDDDLEAIREAGRQYLQELRDRGPTQPEVDELLQKVLQIPLKQARTPLGTRTQAFLDALLAQPASIPALARLAQG